MTATTAEPKSSPDPEQAAQPPDAGDVANGSSDQPANGRSREQTTPEQDVEQTYGEEALARREAEQVQRNERLSRLDPSFEFKEQVGISGAAALGPYGRVFQTNIYNGASAELPGEPTVNSFDSVDIAEIHTGHLRVANHAELVARLRERHLQVLAGPPSTGRRATAMVALVDLLHKVGPKHCDSGCDGDHELSYIQLDAKSPLERLLSWSPEEHHGYIMELATTEQRQALTSVQLRLLRNVFRGSFLVLIAEDDLPDDVGSHTDDVLRHVPPPALEILTAYLRAAPDVCTDDLVDHVRVRQNLVSNSHPQKIRRLGERLVHGLRAGRSVEEILPAPASILRQSIREKLYAEAVGEDGTTSGLLDLTAPAGRIRLRKLTYLAASAVLDGRQQPEVLYAADCLFTRLLPAETPHAPTIQEMFGYRVDDLLEFLRTGGTGILDVRAWESCPRVVRFATPELVGAVLDVCWNDYPGLRNPLLNWLCDLAEGEPKDRAGVWASAAQAIGHLAGYDFDHFRDRIIRPWAFSHRRIDRQAAADALEVVAFDPALRPTVRALLITWISSGVFNSQHTAVLAYQNTLGRLFPADAWAGLIRLAEDKRYSHSHTIAFAIDNLAKDAAPSAHLALLRLLADWSESKLPQLRVQSTRCFALLAWRNAASPNRAWPLLLRAATTPNSREALTTIWRCGLDSALMRNVLWRRLGSWVGRIGIDPELDEAMETVLDGIAGRAALRRRLVFHLRRWRQTSRSPLLDSRIHQFEKE
ncbi:hypothetical protein [Flindersiella endophytica]